MGEKLVMKTTRGNRIGYSNKSTSSYKNSSTMRRRSGHMSSSTRSSKGGSRATSSFRPSGRRSSTYALPGGVDSPFGRQQIAQRFSTAQATEGPGEEAVDLHHSAALGTHDSYEPMGLRRKEIRMYLATSYLGYGFDLLNGFFSMSSVLLVLCTIYFPDYRPFEVVDLIICVFFLFDYVLRLYIADSRFQQILSPQAIVDLLTILPTFTTLFVDLRSVNEFKMSGFLLLAKDIGLYYVRFLRLLRLRRLMTYVGSEQKKEIGTVIINLITSLLFMASVLYSTENHFRLELKEGPLEFLEVIYFLVVTFSTVGYGDISMITVPGKMLITLLICLALFYIPKSTNKILKNIGANSIYSTSSYHPASSVCHVVVTGYADPISARDFLKEIFHVDHGSSNLHVVFLMNGSPSKGFADLVEAPKYRSLVTYLDGSSLSNKDLARAAMSSASACFILTNKFASNPAKFDAISILKALSVKRYVLHNSGHDILVCVQFIRPESRNLFAISRASIPCHLVDQVISIEQVKMDIIAKSCLCPGLNTMLANLIGSMEVDNELDDGDDDNVDADDDDDEEDETGHAEDDLFDKENNKASDDFAEPESILTTAKTKVVPISPSTKSSMASSEMKKSMKWVNHYKLGASYEIYRTKLMPAFCGVPFCRAVEAVYRVCGVLMFAIDVECESTLRQRVLLNPGKLTFPDTEAHNVHAFVIAQDDYDADLTFSRETGNGLSRRNRLISILTKILKEETNKSSVLDSTLSSIGMPATPIGSRGSADSDLHHQWPQEIAVHDELNELHELKEEDEEEEVKMNSFTEDSETLESDSINDNSNDEKEMSKRDISQEFEKVTLWSNLKQDLHNTPKNKAEDDPDDNTHYHINKHHLPLQKVLITSSLEDEFPLVRDHIIVVGNLDNMVCFVRTLRAKYLNRMIPILLFASEPPTTTVWQKLAMFPLVFVCLGSHFEETDWHRAGICFAMRVVIVATNAKTGSDHGILRDANAILARRTIQRIDPRIEVIVEIVNSDNLYLLNDFEAARETKKSVSHDMKQMEAFDDIDSILEVLEYQKRKKEKIESTSQKVVASGSVFTTSTLDILICQSFYNPHLLSVMQILISGSNSKQLQQMKAELTASLGPFGESNLYQIPLPQGFIGRTYGALLHHMTSNEIVPLGLYRCGVGYAESRIVSSVTGFMTADSINTMGENTAAGSRVPFVWTNPASNSVLQQGDFVYILSINPPSNNEPDHTQQILKMVESKHVSSDHNHSKTTESTEDVEKLELEMKRLREKLDRLKAAQ